MQKQLHLRLSDIILKVQKKQTLTSLEHLLYLMHVQGLTMDEALKLTDGKNIKPLPDTPPLNK